MSNVELILVTICLFAFANLIVVFLIRDLKRTQKSFTKEFTHIWVSNKNDQMYVGFSNDVWIEILASDPTYSMKYQRVTETISGHPVIVRKRSKSDQQVFKMIGSDKVLVQDDTPRHIRTNGVLEAEGSMLFSVKTKCQNEKCKSNLCDEHCSGYRNTTCRVNSCCDAKWYQDGVQVYCKNKSDRDHHHHHHHN